MNDEPKQTLYLALVRKLQNNRLIAAGLLIVVIIAGFSTFQDSIKKISMAFQSSILGRTPELQAEYCQLLRPLIIQLDRSKAAFNRWNGKDLSLESESIRDANLKARTLLENNGNFIPESLRKDQKKLITHYDMWLEEYDRVRVKKTKNPDQEFVFVFNFPRESEKNFRLRLLEAEDKLGSDATCK